MKKIRMLYRWVIISVMLQAIVLAYLNYIYLPHRSSVKATMFEQSGAACSNWSIKLPDDARHPGASYDGRYAAYFQDEKIIITDAVKKKEEGSISADKGELTYYTWLPDRNMLIYASSYQVKKSSTVVIETYDVLSGEKRSYPEITGLPSGSSAVDIELSPLTNIVYVKIKTSDERARIYRFNIMDNRKLIMKTELDTVIKETNYSDKLVFQSGNYKINVRDGNKSSIYTLKFKSKMALLGIDSEDKVYVAELNKGGRASNVYFGKADAVNVDTWEKISLKAETSPENLIVSRCGVVYMKLPGENQILALGVDREYKYTGEFVEITDDYILTKEKGKLKLSCINRDMGLK